MFKSYKTIVAEKSYIAFDGFVADLAFAIILRADDINALGDAVLSLGKYARKAVKDYYQTRTYAEALDCFNFELCEIWERWF